MRAEEAKGMKEPNDTNRRLNHLVVELSIDNQTLKHVVEGSRGRFPETGRRSRRLVAKTQMITQD
jgi:hypothetical protein